VEKALAALECREKLILQLAIFAGVRPGELLAMQREYVKADGSVIEIRRAVYRGKFAVPKNCLLRTIAVPPRTASLLTDWMEEAVERNPEACVFAGETGQPLWRSSLLQNALTMLRPGGRTLITTPFVV
jgi:integrase